MIVIGEKLNGSIPAAARAIAKRPEVFIFDDSFSALDFKTDVTLRKALKKRTKDSTVLIVAQRISTILNAEQIIVLDDGRVAGIGTHQELLAKKGIYAVMWNEYNRSASWTIGGKEDNNHD